MNSNNAAQTKPNPGLKVTTSVLKDDLEDSKKKMTTLMEVLAKVKTLDSEVALAQVEFGELISKELVNEPALPKNANYNSAILSGIGATYQ